MDFNFDVISKNYSRLLVEYGTEQFDDGDRVFILNELVYTFEQVEGQWVPVGLGFSLFGYNSILLHEEGTIFVTDDVSGEEDFYEITDPKVLEKNKEFLIWRLKILKDLQM